MARVLVVAAHADDETLGCGATLRRHSEQGDETFGIYLTDGVGARGDDLEAVRRRSLAADRAANALGFEWIARGDFPDNQMDSVPLLEIIQFVEAAVTTVKPNVVYTHSGSDLNVDHRLTFQAVLTALRPFDQSPCRELLSFEVPSSTEWSADPLGSFTPTVYVDVQDHWDAKLEALGHYDEEMREYPHPRSQTGLEALARKRGMEVGLDMAEAFVQVRRIVR